MVDSPGCSIVVVIQEIVFGIVEHGEKIAEGHKPEIGVRVFDLGEQLDNRLRGRI